MIFSVILFTVSLIGPSQGFLGTCEDPLFVGSFNIKHFGRSVMAKTEVADEIKSIVSRWDIFLILETRDSSHTALNDLWTLLNKTGEPWGLVESDPLGRTKYYQEQYVMFYKTDKLALKGTYQDPDANDDFEREPFAAEFEYCSVKAKGSARIVFQGLHSQPSDTPAELAILADKIKDLKNTQFPDASGVVSMGDFNADCSYLSNSKQAALEIFKPDGEFGSIISDDADTTVSKTVCAYDRVITYPKDAVDARNGEVYNYQTELDLDDKEAAAVSDHFPVQFELY